MRDAEKSLVEIRENFWQGFCKQIRFSQGKLNDLRFVHSIAQSVGMHRVLNKYHSGTNTVWRDWWLETEGDGRKQLAMHWSSDEAWKTEEYREREGGRVEKEKQRFEFMWTQLLSTCEEKWGPASGYRNTVLKQHAGDSHWSLTQEEVLSQHTQWLKSPGTWTYVSRGLGQIGYCTQMNNRGIIWEQQIANKMRKIWNKLVSESEQECFPTCLEIEGFGQSPTLVLKHTNGIRKQGSSVMWQSSVTEMRS